MGVVAEVRTRASIAQTVGQQKVKDFELLDGTNRGRHEHDNLFRHLVFPVRVDYVGLRSVFAHAEHEYLHML